MEATLERVFFQAAGTADTLRAWVLRITLSVPLLRVAFRSRAARLALLFILACAFTLFTSLFFPLWVLAIGPAVYGVPHLVASLRYFHYSASPDARTRANRSTRRRAFAILAVIMVLGAAYRLAMPMTGLSEWRGSSYTEIVGTLLVFVAGAVLYRKGWQGLAKGAVLLAPLVVSFGIVPAETVGVLVLLHNFVAFVYWWLAARTRAEKGVALAGGIALTALTALIFMGRLDRLYRGWAPLEELGFAELSFESVGLMIAPESESAVLWRHAAVAYAFGQAMHYFVWLKAIPDQHHRNEIPTSFRQSLSLLGDDFGKKWAVRIIVIAALSAGAWFAFSFPTARWAYFCLAAFHGYFEIAGLALVLCGAKRVVTRV